MEINEGPQTPGPNSCTINNTRGKLEKLGNVAGKLGSKVGAKSQHRGTYFRIK